MSCCGKKRQQLHVQPVAIRVPEPQATSMASRLAFEYTGNGAMAVIGPGSGIRYSFEKPGARVEVDPRDSHFLSTLRDLRMTV
jgi:hypothetical protein